MGGSGQDGAIPQMVKWRLPPAKSKESTTRHLPSTPSTARHIQHTMSAPASRALRRCVCTARPVMGVRPAVGGAQQRIQRRWQSDAAAAPANPKIATIVDQISQLTLLETADLVSTLKVRLRPFENWDRSSPSTSQLLDSASRGPPANKMLNACQQLNSGYDLPYSALSILRTGPRG
jgi:Ribosomal protein L7/L12 dimerisation domain